MRIKIKRKTRNIEKLAKKIKTLKKQKIESGYFKEHGNHPEADMPYAQLMNMHEYGMGNFPIRPVRSITINSLNLSGFSKVLSDYLYDRKDINTPLDDIGEYSARIAKAVFGDTTKLADNSVTTIDIKGFNSPLVEFGHLYHNWGYRTSADKVIQDGGLV